MSMSEDEYKQHMKMKRLEAEAQEEVIQFELTTFNLMKNYR